MCRPRWEILSSFVCRKEQHLTSAVLSLTWSRSVEPPVMLLFPWRPDLGSREPYVSLLGLEMKSISEKAMRIVRLKGQIGSFLSRIHLLVPVGKYPVKLSVIFRFRSRF